MKNSDILTVKEIKEIKDLNRLNTLIKQYEAELNRRRKILEKYASTDTALVEKAMWKFAGLSGTPGFRTQEISSPDSQNIIVARARLMNLSSALLSGDTQIRSLRKKARLKKEKAEKELYKTLNKYEHRVTHKQIQSLTASDWAAIRQLLEKYNYYDSDDVVESYIQSSDKTEDSIIAIVERRAGQAVEAADSEFIFEW